MQFTLPYFTGAERLIRFDPFSTVENLDEQKRGPGPCLTPCFFSLFPVFLPFFSSLQSSL